MLEYTLLPVGAVSSVLLLDPANGRLYYRDASVSSETEKLRFAHTSNRAGEYRLCFTNREGRGQQTVSVQLRVGANSPEKAAGGEIARKETLKPMESKLQQLDSTTQQILTEMKALSTKEVAMKAQAGQQRTCMRRSSDFALQLLTVCVCGAACVCCVQRVRAVAW